MRRRVLQATLSALAVAMVLLGIPLGVFAYQLVHDDAMRDLESRTAIAGRAIDVRYRAGELIDQSSLENYLGSASTAPRHIQVSLPDGRTLVAGEEPRPALRDSFVTDEDVIVILSISKDEVELQAWKAVGLVFAVGAVAVAASVAVALWQASRLAAPLVYLAASAEQLGAGQTRPRPRRSGVEEIDMVADELARSADRMAARLAVERQFAADASHQLRTPLTALSMRIEEIATTSSEEEVRVEAAVALEQVERLVGVVDALLGRTRRSLGAGTTLVRLGDVVEQQRDEWAPAFAKAGRRRVIVPRATAVFATPGALSQVLATLLENSLIHGGGTTTLTVRPSEPGQTVVIEVRDEGDGVPEELAAHIFERSVGSGKGTGIGLALARDLVAADGGRLELAQRVPAAFALFLQAAAEVDLESVVPHSSVQQTRKRGRAR